MIKGRYSTVIFRYTFNHAGCINCEDIADLNIITEDDALKKSDRTSELKEITTRYINSLAARCKSISPLNNSKPLRSKLKSSMNGCSLTGLTQNAISLGGGFITHDANGNNCYQKGVN